MKRVHISKDHLSSIKLEKDVSMELANDIWLSIRDHRMHVVENRLSIDYPTIPKMYLPIVRI